MSAHSSKLRTLDPVSYLLALIPSTRPHYISDCWGELLKRAVLATVALHYCGQVADAAFCTRLHCGAVLNSHPMSVDADACAAYLGEQMSLRTLANAGKQCSGEGVGHF
jgi:hypothetical protein